MSKGTVQGVQLLSGWRLPTIFEKYPGNLLPPEYVKFFKEFTAERKPVHYIPQEGKYERNERNGEIKPIQNVPIPLYKVPEQHLGIWGGESVIKGFQKRHPRRRRVPHFWVPDLKKSVVHSVVLNRYMSIVVTNRTIELILEHRGFDKYLLETKACDLNSFLALKLKRDILKAIQAGCPDLADDPVKQKEIHDQYKKYGDQYTPEELEWYGLSFPKACEKIKKIKEEEAIRSIKPLKHEFRQRLYEQLKDIGVDQVEHVMERLDSKKSWISRINPFK